MVKLTDAFLRKAAEIAERARLNQARLTDAFVERYGVTYSDVDADWLIDALDYGAGTAPTLADCDRIMAERGHPATEEPKP